jgi:hypothetical protein
MSACLPRFRGLLVEGILHRPHHSNVLDRQGVRNLRAYLAHSRVTPSQYEAAKPGANAP